MSSNGPRRNITGICNRNTFNVINTVVQKLSRCLGKHVMSKLSIINRINYARNHCLIIITEEKTKLLCYLG